MMESNVIEVINKRKSIRKYSNNSISDSVIRELLKCSDSDHQAKTVNLGYFQL